MTATAARLGDRYVLGEVLGRGGMGTVHRALDERLEREVAVKVLPTADGDQGARLRQEAQILAQLDHPALVRVLDADEHDGQPFIVMDLVDGVTLRHRLQEGPLEEPEVRRMAQDIVAGLAHAHDQGVVHRDLKPANLVLGADGRTRVVDFGIARLMDATGLTKPGTTIGTVAYLAPEQLDSTTDVGPAADIYTLGLVLLEALTGTRAFAGPAVATALARLERAPEIPGTLPEPWPRLLARMTALAPDERPSATEVADALDEPAEEALTAPPAVVEVGDTTVAQAVALEPGASTTLFRPEVDEAEGAPSALEGGPPDRGGPFTAGDGAEAWVRAHVAHLLAGVVLTLVLVLVFVSTRDDGDAANGNRRAEASDTPAATIPPDVAEALDHLRSTVEP